MRRQGKITVLRKRALRERTLSWQAPRIKRALGRPALRMKRALSRPMARADLSFMQWYAGDTASEDSKAANYTTPLSPTSSYSLEVPGWQEGHTDANAPANASGDGDPENEPKVVASHGTHVAGIIAANWNGDGISGVANGVKIFSVNVFGGDGNVQELKSTIKGFQFLIDAAQEVNLKAVNCSWGTGQMHFSLAVMMEELGRKGVNTVIASGNRYCDLDETMDLSVLTNSPYAIVVDAASMDGSMTDFSCWGQQSTDVFAPGSSILSDVSAYVRIEAEGQLFNFQDDTSFYPEVTDKEHLLSSIEQFSEETPAVRFFDENPALNDAAREIGEINTANGFDDKRSFSVRVPELHKEAQMPNGGYSAINGYVYLAIPVPAGADPRWISVKTAMSDGFKPNGGIDSITCAGTDGKPVEIDCTCVNPGKKGLNASAFYHIYQCQWNNLSYDVAGFIDASNEVHRMLEKGMDENERRSQGLLDYRDPGEIRGVYTWEDGGQTYLIARIGIGNVTEDSRSLEAADDTSLYIDNVAVGDADAFTGAYLLMSGTSMAAPAVAGCLGVIAKDEPENASLTDAELAQAARERAAKLMAAVDYDDSLSGLCRTGGRVNLHGQTQFTRKAPLISRAQAENRVLKLAGWYFGSKGTLAIDGTELTENLTKIELLCDGVVVETVENVAPGAAVEITTTVETPNYYTYQVIAYNASGIGLPSDKVKVWIGQDAPGSFYGVQAADNGTSVEFSWPMVTEGANGYYLNPDDVEYQILATEFNGWSYDFTDVLGSVTGADHYTLEYNTDEGEQQFTTWGVKPVNEAGEGYPVSVTLLTGAPYALPFEENFADGDAAYLWEKDSNAALYVVDQASDDDGYGLAMTTTWFTGDFTLKSGKLALQDASNPVLYIDVKSNGVETLRIMGSTLADEPVLLQDVTLSDEWTTIAIPLNDIKDARYSRLAFTATFVNPSTEDWMSGTITTWGDAVFFDNIRIVDENDSGIESVQSDEMATQTGIFTIDGRRVNSTSNLKGFYIVNGKKIFIK